MRELVIIETGHIDARFKHEENSLVCMIPNTPFVITHPISEITNAKTVALCTLSRLVTHCSVHTS